MLGVGPAYRAIHLVSVLCSPRRDTDIILKLLQGKSVFGYTSNLPIPCLHLLLPWSWICCQDGLDCTGNLELEQQEKKKWGHKERRFQWPKPPHLGSDQQISCAMAALRSLSHKPGLCNIKHYRNGEQPCLLQAETTQQLCRIPFTGQKFLLCNGVSSLPTENTALQPKHTLSLTMSGSPSSPSRGISKCSGKITIFTSSSYSNFSSVISNPPSTPTGRKKHCSNRWN